MKKKNRTNRQRQSAGRIEPWREESSHLPQRFLRSTKKKKQLPFSNKGEPFLKLYKTDRLSTAHAPSKSMLFLDEAINQTAFMSCLNLSEIDVAQMTSNLKLHLSCTGLKEQTLIVARKRTKKGLEIKSLKRRILSSHGLSTTQLQSQNWSQNEMVHKRPRQKTQHKFRVNTLQIEASPYFQPIVNKKAQFKDRKKRENQGFVSQIATIFNQKNRIMIHNKENRLKLNTFSQSAERRADSDRDSGLGRQLFMKRNQKFKGWFGSNRKMLFSSLTPKDSK